MQNNVKIRKYIRHPSDVPLKVSLDWVEDEHNRRDHPCENLHNVSLGGLAIVSPQPLPIGQQVQISFPFLARHQHLTAAVKWNKKIDSHFEIGLKFRDAAELYRLRMIEQICHIEHYRKQVKILQNRHLSSEDAAKEWISLYAKDFPDLNV